MKSLLTSFGGYKLHNLTADVVIRYVDHLQTTPIPAGRRSGGQRLRDKSIRTKLGLLSQILRAAKARRIIPLNPVQDLDWKEFLGEVEVLTDYCVRIRQRLQTFNNNTKRQAFEALDIRVQWIPEQPLVIQSQIPINPREDIVVSPSNSTFRPKMSR